MSLRLEEIQIPLKSPCNPSRPTERKKSPKGYDNGIWGLLGGERGRVELFVNFVDFQFLKFISLVGGLKGLLVRVSDVKGLKTDSIILQKRTPAASPTGI